MKKVHVTVGNSDSQEKQDYYWNLKNEKKAHIYYWNGIMRFYELDEVFVRPEDMK